MPFLPAAWRAFRAATHRERAALVVIGAGASAVATALFTAAFRFGDPVTPLVLQKLQPVIAVVVAALLALGAAALWAVGTVLGRLVSVRISSRDVTVLRFATGLPASAVVLVVQGAPVVVTPAQLGPLALLALFSGLLGLTLYYIGLRSTPAARATLAEMAFPVTAALIGVAVLGARLSPTQWLGLAVVVVSVTALGLRERSSEPVVRVART